MDSLITNKTIERLSELSMLKISPSDMTKTKEDLTAIIKHLSLIESINTDQITPLSHPLETSQPLRSDIITETDKRKQLQALTSHTQNELYLVPNFIDRA